jgi:hypothetical protein
LPGKGLLALGGERNRRGRAYSAQSHHIGLPVGGFAAICGGLTESFEQVPAHVWRGSERGVAEPSLDRLRKLALGDEQGGVGVAQIMEPAWATD